MMKANAWSSFWNSLSPRRRKQVVWILGLLVFYAILGFLILPPIVRAIAVKQLSQQLDREVSIEKIKINPFAFSTTVRGLLIKDKDGQPFISWDEVYVNFQLRSFLGHPWVFRKISVTGPFVRAQMNQDGTFNFSDLLAKFASTNAPATPATPAKLPGLWIYRLEITNATASVTDLTHRRPFKRLVGPIAFAMENFQTDPDNKNPHTCTGTTDAGEKIAWSGFFYLDPLRSWGELTLENLALNKYQPEYEDLLPVEIRDGIVGLNVHYHLDLSTTNRVMEVTNTSFTLRNFKVAEQGAETNLVELANLAVTGVSADAVARRADIGFVSGDGGRLNRLRSPNTITNALARTAIKAAQSVVKAARQLNSVPELLGVITNGVAQLLQTTNLGAVTIRDVEFNNCALHLEDLTTTRPARLDLDEVALSVKNISNLPETNLTAELSLRWNTNGTIKIDSSVSFAPLTADVELALDKLDFGTLAPYLESELNLLIPDSQFCLHGQVQVRTPEGQLPEINFRGDTWIDGLRVVDGVIGEDLLKWNSVRVSGIEANVNPLSAAIREIAVDSVAAHVVIDTNQTINLFAALKPVGATNAPIETNAAVVDETKPPRRPIVDALAALAALPPFSIGSIVISNTSASYNDRSLTPNVNMTVLEFGGTIAGISSSNRSQPADINLGAKVNGVGPVNITGTLYPFTVAATNDLKITLKDMDLTPASPYSGKFAGYRIALGKLNLDLAYNLVGTQLKSTNIITLDRFTFGDKVESPDATSLPVRLAIALLKDRNGQILLEVPVDGSLDDPKFHVGKVVWETVLNVLAKAATSPFSLIGAAFGGGGEELGYEDFVPGRSELTSDDNKKLDTLVKALYDRPGLSLEIAGSIDPVADRDGLQRVFLEKQIHLKKWQSLRKSRQATITPDQVALTPEERADWVKKLYHEAWANHQITPEMLAANTNIANAVAQLRANTPKVKKGATILVQGVPAPTAPAANSTASSSSALKLPPVTDPTEVVLLASISITDNDFEALASDRAKAVRAYILETGKVEATRLFLTENQTGGVRSEGSRVYLQFQ
jgi:hypothetical protein